VAYFPCSNHHAPYRGPSAAAYPALVDGPSTDRRHLRMCQPCFGDYLDSVAQRLSEVQFDDPKAASPSETAQCSFCGAPNVETPIAAFVTAYPPKTSERAFYGRVCRGCELKAKSELLLS